MCERHSRGVRKWGVESVMCVIWKGGGRKDSAWWIREESIDDRAVGSSEGSGNADVQPRIRKMERGI